MAFLVDAQPNWLEDIGSKVLNGKNFLRIVDFFLFNTPCQGLSARSIKLNERNWNDPWVKPYYLNKQLRQKSTNYNLLYSAASYDAIEQALDKADLKDKFPSKLKEERVVIYDGLKNQFMSCFYHIRNSIAHSRFNIIEFKDELIYVFEDVVKHKGEGKLSARMILKESTLINWIELIESGERQYIEDEIN